MPKNRGGGDVWDNLVAACQPCNRTKGSRTPEEAKMVLIRHPKKPNKIHILSSRDNYDVKQLSQ